MKKNLKKSELVAVGLAGLVALLLSARGLFAIITSSFHGSSRTSGPYEVHGLAAQFLGGGYVGMGLLVLCGVGLHLKIPRRKMIPLSVASLLLTLGCLVARFMVVQT